MVLILLIQDPGVFLLYLIGFFPVKALPYFISGMTVDSHLFIVINSIFP
jgi:hypothetical protein